MVKRYALVRLSSGLVLNVCRWDGQQPWNDLPDDVEAVECPEAVGPGWSLSGPDWIPPPEPPPEE